MTLKNKDFDVYFHMRNHYRKLKNTKSTFIVSPPKAVPKRALCSSPHCNTAQNRMKFEVRHFSNVTHIPYYDVPNGHVCVYSADRTSDTALLPRPRTRRNPNDWSPEEMLDRKYRSQSVGGIPRKTKTSKKNHCYSSRQYTTDQDSLTEEPLDYHYGQQSHQYHHHKRKKKTNMKGTSSVSCSTNTAIEEESEGTGSSRKSSEKRSRMGDVNSSTSIEEHEYLQFLLRVTEDIIINNYILNEDIERVFKQHIEMNKHVLDEQKMEKHITNLAVELNLSEDLTPLHKDRSLQVSPSYVNLLSLNTSCQCENANNPLDSFFEPLSEQNKENLDDIIYCRHSLGRVTECTEPSNSSATIAAKFSNPNIQFGHEEHPMTETKSETIITSDETIGKELRIRETLSEIVITEKSSPADSLKDIPKETEKTYTIEHIGNDKITEENRIKESPTKVDCGTETSFEENIQKIDVKVQANLPPERVFEQSVQTSPRIIPQKPTSLSKSTQSTSIVSNKKCDTEDLSEYVVVTNPPAPKEFFSEFQDGASEEEVPLTNRSELEGVNTFLELKLLGDDYDLTPERDTSEKYYFLMSDASTSMKRTAVTMTDEEGLLVGDTYELREESAMQRIPNNRDTHSHRWNRKGSTCEDEISSSSDHVKILQECPRWLSEKSEFCYPTIRKLHQFAPITNSNTCISTSPTSVRT